VNSDEDISLSQYGRNSSLAIIFFCNGCPYSTFYIDRIKGYINEFPETQFLLVNSADSEFAPEESAEGMTALVQDSELTIPYLADKDKLALKALGGRKCPEVFVIDPRNWQVMYHGAIDNNPQVAADVSEAYLKEVLIAVNSGNKPSTTYQRPTGCTIK
jgi:hypothetical protein